MIRKKTGIIIISSVIIGIVIIVGGIFTKRSIESPKEPHFQTVKMKTVIPESVFKEKSIAIQRLVHEDSNPKVKAILANLNLYPKQLVELASYDKEAIDFVYNYPTRAKYYQNAKINIKDDYKKGQVPLFIQWDERWGYDKYGDNYMAVNGCGPTALAMVIVGITGDTNINPYVVAKYSEKNNLYIDGKGTEWSLMTKGAEHFGIKGTEMPLTKEGIIETLKAGTPIIAAMGPGAFTKTGHFVVLTGITKDGRVEVKDSNSIVNSNKTWNINIFMKQTLDLWKFTKK